MLIGPRKRLWERPSVVVALMVAVLVLGLGIGVGVGLLAGRTAPPQPPVEPEQAIAVEPPPPPVEPVVPPPAPRPEGASNVQAPPPSTGVALMAPPPAPVPPASGGLPPWQRFAVASPPIKGRPMVTVVIDDLGLDRRRAERVLALPAPLTLAFMTYAEDLPQLTATARSRGHELMVHVPMQPLAGAYDPGPDVLEVGQSPDEIRRRLAWGLSRFDGFVGLNNHMGSRFTANAAGMQVVMEDMRRRGLAFLDSVTTDHSVGAAQARRYGVPFAARDVFLDNEQSVSAVRGQLAKLEELARKRGHAIAIGHPHDATIEALAGWLPRLEGRGLVLVPLTTIIRTHGPGGP
ncbi:MAG: divergent polysaccharide deacetylase family protein [Magnetospirillum sp.]|nr:divergent polysaccharide deacetylase family protein [Magnetospirillum sp.]